MLVTAAQVYDVRLQPRLVERCRGSTEELSVHVILHACVCVCAYATSYAEHRCAALTH